MISALGGLLQQPRGGRMVAMGMGDEDRRDRLALQPVEQGLDMGGQVGAGVDDRHLAFADHIGAGAGEGERPGIGRDDAPDQRRDAQQMRPQGASKARSKRGASSAPGFSFRFQTSAASLGWPSPELNAGRGARKGACKGRIQSILWAVQRPPQ